MWLMGYAIYFHLKMPQNSKSFYFYSDCTAACTDVSVYVCVCDVHLCKIKIESFLIISVKLFQYNSRNCRIFSTKVIQKKKKKFLTP